MEVGKIDTFLFVGERRSNRAMQMEVTWHDGRLAAKTLFEGLQAAGINPHKQDYINIWDDTNKVIDANVEAIKATTRTCGWTVVGMGQRVCKYLISLGIPHTQIVHPAARGTIRKTENYQAHLREKLLPAGNFYDQSR